MNDVCCIKKNKDIEALKSFLKENNLRNYLLFVIGVNTGLKTCILLNLKFSDFLDEHISIKDNLFIDGVKYKITQSIKDAIGEYIRLNCINMNEYIFKSTKGDFPINRSHLYRILNSAAQECNLGFSIGNETLRKTFGYHYYLQTKDYKHLQCVFNKRSKRILFEYLGISVNFNELPEFDL